MYSSQVNSVYLCCIFGYTLQVFDRLCTIVLYCKSEYHCILVCYTYYKGWKNANYNSVRDRFLSTYAYTRIILSMVWTCAFARAYHGYTVISRNAPVNFRARFIFWPEVVEGACHCNGFVQEASGLRVMYRPHCSLKTSLFGTKRLQRNTAKSLRHLFFKKFP